MQKLEERNTYTPTDIPHVRSNCGLSLNRTETSVHAVSTSTVTPVDCVSTYCFAICVCDVNWRNGCVSTYCFAICVCDVNWRNGLEETLSVSGLKTSSNNSDAALTASGHAGQDLQVPAVYVLNMRGKPLMPTTPRKARTLLKEGKAKVVKRTPFTIQLIYATGEAKQEIALGVDIGYENIGLSAKTNKKEVYSAEVKLRTDIVKLNSERRQYRRARRNRKTGYFDLRKLDGTKVHASAKAKELVLLENAGTLLIERIELKEVNGESGANSSPPFRMGYPLPPTQ